MPLLGWILFSLALGAILVALARHQQRERERRALEKLVESRSRELAELSTHLQNFAEQEKSALARNLHDELGGLLTAAKMDLSWLQARLNQPAYQERLAQLGAVLDEAMNVKRRLVDDLRPSLLDHFGLPTALRAHVEAACLKANLKLDTKISDDAAPVPREIAIALFRVAQEGLTNIIRHADAHRVRLEFANDANDFIMTLGDDGHGFAASSNWSHGLIGMRHRVNALHGKFALVSIPGSGTKIHVTVPRPI